MSIYSKVLNECSERKRQRSDDLDLESIIDALTHDEQEIWVLEFELAEELRPEHGLKPDFHDIVEREIYARGIEKR